VADKKEFNLSKFDEWSKAPYRKLFHYLVNDFIKIAPEGEFGKKMKNDEVSFKNESPINPATGSYMIGALDSSGNTFGSSGSER